MGLVVRGLLLLNFLLGVIGVWNEGTATLTGTAVDNNAALNGQAAGFANIGSSSPIARATLNDSSVSGNTASLSAGGIWNTGSLSATNSAIRGNEATSAGGLLNNGSVDLNGSMVSGNTATMGPGGGLINSGFGGRLTLTMSTVSDNTAATRGGGILNQGNTLAVENSTLSGNLAQAGDGGAIFTETTLTTQHVTIARNSTGNTGGGVAGSGTWTTSNTLIEGNLPGNCSAAISLTSLGNNLDSSANCSGLSVVMGDVLGIPAQIGPLAANGGPTLTHALLPTSPAIEAGSAASVLTDQRGLPRVGQPDIGAFEVQNPDADGDTFEPIAAGGEDCDDTNATIFPGAPEIPDDGVDQDCDGRDLSGAPRDATQPLLPGFNAIVFPGPDDTPIEAIVATLGPVDAVFRFDAEQQTWEVFRPSASIPALNTLRVAQVGEVLFVHRPPGPPGEWSWPDSLQAGPVSVVLRSGFTFVGYTGAAIALTDLLAGVEGVRAAFRFDARAQQYDTFRPGQPAALSTFASAQRFDGLFLLNSGAATTLTWDQVGGGAPPSALDFPDFVDRSGLTLSGSAQVALGLDGRAVIRLTDANTQAGAFFAPRGARGRRILLERVQLPDFESGRRGGRGRRAAGCRRTRLRLANGGGG